jgi:hypothetical protein
MAEVSAAAEKAARAVATAAVSVSAEELESASALAE